MKNTLNEQVSRIKEMMGLNEDRFDDDDNYKKIVNKEYKLGEYVQGYSENKKKFVNYIIANRDILSKHYDDIMQWTEIGKKSREYNDLLQAIESFDDEIEESPSPKLTRLLFYKHVGELDDIAENIRYYKEDYNQEDEPSDDDIYNGFGREGGISYDTGDSWQGR